MRKKQYNILKLNITMQVIVISNEYQAADRVLELHDVGNFHYKDNTLYVKDASDEWTSNKKRIHKTLLQLYRRELGKWIESIYHWN